MRNILRLAVAAAALVAAPAARAQVSVDVKAAYALPIGDVWVASPWNPTFPMKNAWTGAVPFELGVRYRITPTTSIGGYGQYGPAFPASSVLSGTATSGSDLRVGLELAYTFTPADAISPWFSLGTGWEWTRYGNASAAVTMTGWEYFNFQLGLDFAADRPVSFGPYVGIFMGSYSNIFATGDAQGGGGSIDAASRGFHAWFQVGLKGSLNL